jgi:hypothetical protein
VTAAHIVDWQKKPTGSSPVGLPLIQDSTRPGAPSRGRSRVWLSRPVAGSEACASSRPPTEKATPACELPSQLVASPARLINSVQRPFARWLRKGRTATRWRLPPEAPRARMVVNRRSPIRSRGRTPGGTTEISAASRAGLARRDWSVQKRGQAPFAGTALRVLRTKGACPLLEPETTLQAAWPSHALAVPSCLADLPVQTGQRLTSIQ